MRWALTAIVNQALYGPLRGKVRQAKDYSWSLAGTAPPVRGRAEGAPTNPHESLFGYYLTASHRMTIAGSEPLPIPSTIWITSSLEGGPMTKPNPTWSRAAQKVSWPSAARSSEKSPLAGLSGVSPARPQPKGWEGRILLSRCSYGRKTLKLTIYVPARADDQHTGAREPRRVGECAGGGRASGRRARP